MKTLEILHKVKEIDPYLGVGFDESWPHHRNEDPASPGS